MRSYHTPLRPGIMSFAMHSGVPGGFAARSCSAEVASTDFETSGVTQQETCGQYNLQSKTCEEFYSGDYLQSALFDFVTSGDALQPGSAEESTTTAQFQSGRCAGITDIGSHTFVITGGNIAVNPSRRLSNF